jgi:hypothetical protein
LSKGDTLQISSSEEVNIGNSQINRRTIDKHELYQRKDFLDLKLKEINFNLQQRILLARENQSLVLPRLLRLCELYDLNDIEAELMHVLVVASVRFYLSFIYYYELVFYNYFSIYFSFI